MRPSVCSGLSLREAEAGQSRRRGLVCWIAVLCRRCLGALTDRAGRLRTCTVILRQSILCHCQCAGRQCRIAWPLYGDPGFHLP